MNEFIFSNVKNQEKWCKSRLVTTSATKQFIPKVGYFWGKSSLLIGASKRFFVYLTIIFLPLMM